MFVMFEGGDGKQTITLHEKNCEKRRCSKWLRVIENVASKKLLSYSCMRAIIISGKCVLVMGRKLEQKSE
jgi:hypothetical protein